jgi:hypothetical protein
MDVVTELDEQYLVDAVQDPHEPKWTTDADVAEMQQVEDPEGEVYPGSGNVPSVRTSGGHLDFMDDIAEVVEEFLGLDEPVKPSKPKLDPIRTRELGSDKWRPGRREVTAAMSGPIVVQSEKRRKVTLINWGPDIVYISSVGSTIAGASNTARLPVSGVALWAPMPISTRDDIWAVCAVTDSATVEVIEEFDCES